MMMSSSLVGFCVWIDNYRFQCHCLSWVILIIYGYNINVKVYNIHFMNKQTAEMFEVFLVFAINL